MAAHGIILPFRGIEPRLAPDVFLAPGACVIGDVEIGAGSSIWFQCAIRGDVNFIRIGARTNIQDGTIIHVSRRDGGQTVIEDDVTIGHQVLLHACRLHARSFVGMGATVMDDAEVETDAMLGAGSLLTSRKRVLTGQLWLGRPAIHIRDLTADEIAYNGATAAHYSRMAAEYRAALGLQAGDTVSV
ncbi:MAG: gamma carbonic anhydrase family protein [Proteobacteria bacterium]|nr:gamma carbonic anhydrase family protein [Pseudomonadota bacterium]MDA1059675.1 gamma carbonic anhydrase family protein [Pseudomonadota bacterium]